MGVKRFYARAAAIPHGAGGDFAVALDGKPARSPQRAVLAGPRALAEAMAAEWEGQGETLDMATMPLTRLHGRVLDAGPEERAKWADTLVAYAGTDLLCYRGEEPGLAARQAEAWEPYLDRLAARLGARLAVTEGIIAVSQPEDALDAVRGAVAALPDGTRAALAALTEIGGSAVLALAVEEGADADAAFEASRTDERYQAERWGVDAEAAAREAGLRRDWHAAARYVELSR